MERAQFFRARALNVEPGRARACPNFPRASFEPELSTNKNANIRVRAYFEPMGKLGSSSLEPGAYLLRAQNQARAFEPEPRLVPPLVRAGLGIWVIIPGRARAFEGFRAQISLRLNST